MQSSGAEPSEGDGGGYVMPRPQSHHHTGSATELPLELDREAFDSKRHLSPDRPAFVRRETFRSRSADHRVDEYHESRYSNRTEQIKPVFSDAAVLSSTPEDHRWHVDSGKVC